MWLITGAVIEDFWTQLAVRLPLLAMIGGIAYVFFRVDEESGEMEFEVVTDWLGFKMREKVISLEWEGDKK